MNTDKNIKIKNAKYYRDPLTKEDTCICVNYNGVNMIVPMDINNRHYAEILKRVTAKTLKIGKATN